MYATLKLAGVWALGRLQNITDAVLATGASIATMAVIIHAVVLAGLLFIREALIVTQSQANILIDSQITIDLWKITLNIANSIFLFALVVASIAIILRIDTGTYQIKKFITALIAAVAFSNLSLLIMKALVGFGDSLATVFGSIGVGNTDTAFAYLIELSRIPAVPQKTDWFPAVMNVLFGALVLWILFKIIVFIFERMLAIALLTILAPLAFASALLPNLKEYSKGWWPMTIKWILAWPIFIGVIKIATLFLGKLTNDDPTKIASLLSQPLIEQTANSTAFSINEKYLFGIIGLFILYYASELPKKLNLSAPLSGMVGTGTEALAGKGYLGKASNWVGTTVRNTTPGIALEGWRKAQIGQGGKGGFGRLMSRVAGRAFNPQAMRDIATAKTEAAVMEKSIDHTAYAAQEKAKTMAEQEKKVPRDAEGNMIENSAEYATYKNTVNNHKELLGSLQYQNEQLNKKTALESIGSADSLTAKLNKAIKENKPGEAVRAAHQLRTLARSVSRRPEDAAVAKETLSSPSIKQRLDDMGLDSSKYSVRSFSKDIGDYNESMDEEYARTTKERKKLADDLGSNVLAIARDDDTGLSLSLAMLTVLKNIDSNLKSSGAFKSLSDDEKKKHLQTVIDARADTGSTSNNDLIDQIDGQRAITKLTSSEKDLYKEINNALSSATPNNDRQAIGKFAALFNINPAQMPDTILKLEGLQAAEQQEREIETAIKDDNKKSEISFINTIRNQIQAKALKKVSQDNNIVINAANMSDDIKQQLDAAKKAEFDKIEARYSEMGNKLDNSLEKYSADFSNQTVDNTTFNLDDYKDDIRNIPAHAKFFPSESELNDATIGKLKTYQRQVQNALGKIQF
ncbi:type IV secretion system protein [Patescibacteria group bacterium]|nr:type IV secretion system protein [Patescibacteria group bacterium]